MRDQHTLGRQALLSLGILFSALLFLYFPILMELVHDWETNDNYSHGFFIPFISAFFIYSCRHDLKKIPLRGHIIGLFILILGFLQLIIAKAGSEYFLQRTSLIPVLSGMVIFCLGFAFFKKTALPILYLIFMIPLPAIIWNKIAFPMQLFSSSLTEKAVTLMSIPLYREGNVLYLPETTLEVVAACSGLRSLLTLFALSAAFAILSKHKLWQKWLLFFAAAPIAVFANITRLSATALLASRYGGEVAQGFLHEFSGIVVFLVGIGLLIAINALLTDKSQGAATGRPT